jgi:hypothetical protein
VAGQLTETVCLKGSLTVAVSSGDGQSIILAVAVSCAMAQISKDMGALTERGINSFKFFMAYKGILQVNDEQLLHGFLRCKELGALPQVLM